MGDLRVRKAGTRNTRVFHPRCIHGIHKGMDDFVGTEDLGASKRADLVQQLQESAGPAEDPQAAQEILERVAKRARRTEVEAEGPSEELLNMDFWDKVAFPEIMAPVNTMADPPSAMVMELARVKTTVVRAINAKITEGDVRAQGRLWKLLIVMDAMLLQKTGAKRGGRGRKGSGTVAGVVGNRIKMFWNGEWGTLLTEVTDKTNDKRYILDEKDIQAEAKRIKDLIDMGEVRRATGQITDPVEIAKGHEVPSKLRDMFPRGPKYIATRTGGEGAGPGQEGGDLRKMLSKTVEHAPRKLAPGLGGSRYEHWRLLAKVRGGTEQFAELGVNIVTGRVGKEVLEALSIGKITPFVKPDGGLRPIATPSVLLRMVAGSVGKLIATKVRGQCEPTQHGVGTPGGGELLYQTVVTKLAHRPQWGLLSLDEANAFGSLSRGSVASAAEEMVPEYADFIKELLEADKHSFFVDSEGELHRIEATHGVPQGMPLSPYLFPMTLKGPLESLNEKVQELPGGGQVLAFQDDIYVMAEPKEFAKIIRRAREGLASVGLRLNESKTKYWRRKGQPDEPSAEGEGAKREDDIKVLKQSLPSQLTLVEESDRSTRKKAVERRIKICNRVRELARAGLGAHPAMALLRTAVPADASFIMRTSTRAPVRRWTCS